MTSCNLSDCFLCRNCIPQWKDLIALKKKTNSIKKGKTLFREGDKVEGIFFLYSGSMKVHMHWGDQKELIIRFAAAGDILGHRGLGGKEVYPISATALEDSIVCFITNEFFEATLQTNHIFSNQMLHVYATELQRAERRMRDIAHMEVKGRIAGALLEIAGQFGIDDENYIRLTIARQDIASYAGTTYETVFKLFTELINNKIISTEGKRIQLLNVEQLKKFSES